MRGARTAVSLPLLPKSRGKLLLASAALLTLQACHNSTAPEREASKVISSVSFGQPIEVSNQILAGRPATVIVTTNHPALSEPDGAVIEVNGSIARIVPYDLVSEPQEGRLYPALIRIVRREVNVVFEEPGPAVIRVVGHGNLGSQAPLDSVDIAVAVQP